MYKVTIEASKQVPVTYVSARLEYLILVALVQVRRWQVGGTTQKPTRLGWFKVSLFSPNGQILEVITG